MIMEPISNLNHQYQTQTELPQFPESGDAGSLAQQPQKTPETIGLQTTFSAQGQGAFLPAAGPAVATDDSGAAVGTTLASSASSSGATLIADDADLIEKEWVLRAKAIVAQTRNDPHKQNEEMNHVKADYLKKRYNKDLKVNET